MPDTRLYGDLASYYDLMCAQIDYSEQAATVMRLHKSFGRGGRQYLDLACGTGALVEQFSSRGFDATGLDLNPAMLALARERCPTARFSRQDMSEYSFNSRFDLITCLLYSIHYCYPKNRFMAALENTCAALHPGGVLCFDAVDKNAIANDEGIIQFVEQNATQYRLQSRWHYPGFGDRLDLHLNATEATGAQREAWSDRHTMLAVDLVTLQRDLQRIGFEVTLLARNFSRLESWNGTDGNVLVVCVKQGD